MIDLFPIKIERGSVIPTEIQRQNTQEGLESLFSQCKPNIWTGESGLSTGQLNLKLYADIDLSWLFESLYPSVVNYWTSLNYQPMNIGVTSCWANLHRKGDTTRERSHSDGFHGFNVISGVYYFKKPDGIGNIKFCNPLDNILRMTPYKDMQGIDTIATEVETNQYEYILFPSWLRHRVDKHPVDEERIAISFNYVGML